MSPAFSAAWTGQGAGLRVDQRRNQTVFRSADSAARRPWARVRVIPETSRVTSDGPLPSPRLDFRICGTGVTQVPISQGCREG